MIYVKIVRNLPEGRSLVFTKEGQSHQVATENLKASAAWQPVNPELLESLYDFEQEIQERMPKADRIRQNLYRRGVTRKEDLDDPEKLRVLNSLFPKLD